MTGGGARLYQSSPVFSHCTFRNCSVDDDGGGVWCNDSTASFTNCTFKDCESLDDGGGLFGQESGVSLTDCSFEDCQAGGSGGAVYGSGTLGGNDLTVEGCLFDGNVAVWSAGTLHWSRRRAIFFRLPVLLRAERGLPMWRNPSNVGRERSEHQ